MPYSKLRESDCRGFSPIISATGSGTSYYPVSLTHPFYIITSKLQKRIYICKNFDIGWKIYRSINQITSKSRECHRQERESEQHHFVPFRLLSSLYLSSLKPLLFASSVIRLGIHELQTFGTRPRLIKILARWRYCDKETSKSCHRCTRLSFSFLITPGLIIVAIHAGWKFLYVRAYAFLLLPEAACRWLASSKRKRTISHVSVFVDVAVDFRLFSLLLAMAPSDYKRSIENTQTG